ncbi:MAG: exosortase system-associated protein, TIGR04073 family [Myxococcales bacterium]|nr:exosortase system-associated protein, TIGR04073 family [Myxococcales bacterium]
MKAAGWPGASGRPSVSRTATNAAASAIERIFVFQAVISRSPPPQPGADTLPECSADSTARPQGKFAKAAAICDFPAVSCLRPRLCGRFRGQPSTAARKAGRGLAAMTTGFLEVPGNMVAATREQGPAMGLPLGFVIGLGKLVVRELVGVYEFVSAPFEAPAGFQPIIDPEYPWDYFQKGGASSNDKRSN